ncbi:hypothetical protein BQ6471_00502 [Vibrio gazogenes]|nr:hypothetical protein BQ6471_00502 [Vibrio gazogenes]
MHNSHGIDVNKSFYSYIEFHDINAVIEPEVFI